MSMNYILIDFENVRPASVEAVSGEGFRVLVFVGASQRSVPTEFILSLQRFGAKGEYIQAKKNGSNALDFLIAFYIGQLVATDPNASFQIISKDKGFDSLIDHLRAKKIKVTRSESIAGQAAPEAPAKPASKLATEVIAKLTPPTASRPRTLTKLSHAIKALFRQDPALSDKAIEGAINELSQTGFIKITGSKISYPKCESPA